ncbi:MAG: hypothetical protein ACE5KJ_04355, partial [Candidatus Zixiibacteriota bacterium]
FGVSSFSLTMNLFPSNRTFFTPPEGRVKKLFFAEEILCRDRACPCPNSKADSHKGCPYITLLCEDVIILA